MSILRKTCNGCALPKSSFMQASLRCALGTNGGDGSCKHSMRETCPESARHHRCRYLAAASVECRFPGLWPLSIGRGRPAGMGRASREPQRRHSTLQTPLAANSRRSVRRMLPLRRMTAFTNSPNPAGCPAGPWGGPVPLRTGSRRRDRRARGFHSRPISGGSGSRPSRR